jgi:ABC-type Mn2+/Zn2+ transport system ATPase subunit
MANRESPVASVNPQGTVVAELDDACVHYGSVVALAPSTLQLERGSVVALVGANGSGKSTLLNLLAGLLEPTDGTVRRAPNTTIALVPQHQHHHRWMPLAVDDVLRMGRYRARGLLGRFGPSDRAAMAAAAERLDVAALRSRQFGELSGGQRQRVLVAQALVAEPGLLLLDEPITGLDLPSQQRILELIADVRDGGMTVVLSTHHLGEARQADRVLLMAGCVLADGSPSAVLRPELLAEAFGNRAVSFDGDAVVTVVDEHGHGDGEDPIAALVPHQQRHDHAVHRHHDHHHAAVEDASTGDGVHDGH